MHLSTLKLGRATLLGVLLCASIGVAQEAKVVGWRGDWTGRYPEATPVTEWGYWPKSPNHGLKYQVAKPGKDDDGKNATLVTSRELPEWLMIGPFEPKDAAKALDEEFLPNEGELSPAEGDKVGDLVWQKKQFTAKSEILADSLGFQTVAGKTGIAYAHVYLYSKSKGTIAFYLDHDKGAKLWVNGKVVHNNPKKVTPTPPTNYPCYAAGAQWKGELLTPSRNADGQRIAVELEKGWNRVLFKTGGSLILRLVEMADTPYEGKNVVWATKLPNWSNAMPIIVGDKIFTMAEPDFLVCINKADGKLLWKRETNFVDTVTAEDRKRFPQFKELDALSAELKKTEDMNKRVEIRNKMLVLFNQVDADDAKTNPDYKDIIALQAKLKDAAEADKAAIIADIKKKLADLKCTPEANPLYQLVEPIERTLADPNVAAVYRDGLKKKLQENLLTLGPKPRYKFGPGSHIGGTGFTCNTPVSDGKNVYVFMGWGIAACYDLDGNLKWANLATDMGDTHTYNIAAPLMFEDKMIVFRGTQLRAYDKATGKTLWTSASVQKQTGVDVFHGFGTSPSFSSSPCLAKFGDTWVIFFETAVVRATDGKMLATIHHNIIASLRSTPFALGDSIFIGEPTSLSRMPIPADAKEGLTLSMKQCGSAGGDALFYSSPVVHDGLMYGLRSSGKLDVCEADTIKRVYEKQLDADCYSDYDHAGAMASLALGGKYIYAFDNQGTGFVIEPGRTFKQIARNRIDYCVDRIFNYDPDEIFNSAPIFEGGRMYLRGEQNLYCIGEK